MGHLSRLSDGGGVVLFEVFFSLRFLFCFFFFVVVVVYDFICDIFVYLQFLSCLL